MKDKFLMVGLFFLLMATLPLVIFGKNVGTSPTKNSRADKTVQTSAATPDEVAATSYAMTEEAAAASVASLCESDTCDEAVRALCILCKTNLEAGAEVAGGGTVTDSELLERVRAIYDSNNEILTDAGQPVAVPSVLCSNGVTEKSVSGSKPMIWTFTLQQPAFAETRKYCAESFSIPSISSDISPITELLI